MNRDSIPYRLQFVAISRSPEWEKQVAITVAQNDPEKSGCVMVRRVWVCRQPGNKSDGVANFEKCLHVKRTQPSEVARPMCAQHRQYGMDRSGQVYRMPDGSLVRWRL